jgi:hypothetical protein
MSGSLREARAAAGARVAALARRAPDRLAEALRPLSIPEQALIALSLAPHERLETLLHGPQPMRLVRSLPDLDFYLTVREVGPVDALPLLGLASAEQLHHLLDLESWRGDRFDDQRCGAWVALIVEAGEPALRRLLRTADDELLVLLFQRWARVEALEHDEPDLGRGLTETGDERGPILPDGHHRFAPSIPEHVRAVLHVAQLLFTVDPARYRRVLWATQSELPAEVEEQALRWRGSRLEEHGFPPFDEALAVYAPPQGLREHPRPEPPRDPQALGAPALPLLLPALRECPLGALDDLPDPLRERALAELVSLANHLLVADGADTGDPAAHRAALERAAGTVGLALEARGVRGADELAPALAAAPLIELFREGHARAVALQARAQRLRREGFLAAAPHAAQALDGPLAQRLLALADPRPAYVEIAEGGTVRRRPFRSLSEIDETSAALDRIELVGRVIAGLGLDPGRAVAGSGLVLNLLGWHALRGERRLDPLPAELRREFARAGPAAALRAGAALAAELTGAAALSPEESRRWRDLVASLLQGPPDQC